MIASINGEIGSIQFERELREFILGTEKEWLPQLKILISEVSVSSALLGVDPWDSNPRLIYMSSIL